MAVGNVIVSVSQNIPSDFSIFVVSPLCNYCVFLCWLLFCCGFFLVGLLKSCLIKSLGLVTGSANCCVGICMALIG